MRSDTRKPLIVGELNPLGGRPEFALFPLPRGRSGGRLAAFLGLGDAEYLERFDRRNLCSETTGSSLAVLPHPSGKNLAWNDASARALAREAVAALLGLQFRR